MKILDLKTNKVLKKNATQDGVENLKRLGLWGSRYVEAKKLPELNESNTSKKEDKKS